MRAKYYIMYDNNYVCNFVLDDKGYFVKYSSSRRDSLFFQNFNCAYLFIKFVNSIMPGFMRHCIIV